MNDCFVGSPVKTFTSRRNQSAKHLRWNLSERPGLMYAKANIISIRLCSVMWARTYVHNQAPVPAQSVRFGPSLTTPLHSKTRVLQHSHKLRTNAALQGHST